MSVFISAALILASLLKSDRTVTNGLIVGSLISLIFFLSTCGLVNVILSQKKKGRTNSFVSIAAVSVFVFKLPVLGIALWIVFKYVALNPFALMGGIAVTQAAILIAGLGHFLKK